MFYLLVLSDAQNNIQAQVIAGLYTRKVVGIRDAIKLVDDEVADVATLYSIDKAGINDYHDKGLLDSANIAFSTDLELNPNK